ncbi:hypothetical protein ACH5RR_026676, partial [Cinchona calisaya]
KATGYKRSLIKYLDWLARRRIKEKNERREQSEELVMSSKERKLWVDLKLINLAKPKQAVKNDAI